MTSTILTGERRWASARRTGMTVLGKVAVPKPINLPSQRLENHGLDPNVEIVPKGTLSWGSRSSSSSSNPWSSSQSPNTDGSTSSLSHLSGRPSSGGSGTRPSTAGSDRAHESTASSGGPNSRPSSASGPVGSNQNSLAFVRPRSAETRPSSSHLSRFTEASSENSIAWSSVGSAEKLGVVQYKDEGFALTSGDFPVLGSEKGNGRKNSESRDHESTKRPGSSSGGVALTRESSGTSESDDVSHNENVKITTVNSWSRDNPPYGEDGDWYGTEKWQRHSHPYTGANMVSPPFHTFNCIPPNNPQGGVLNRGPRGGLPCGPPAPPTGFPMEPFPYYYSHLSAGPPANSQPVHPARGGPRGHHSQTDVYRNPVPDAFVRPAMLIRPGFFPGPVPYEGCYGSSSSRGINDRDAAFPGLVSVKGDSSHSQISLKVLTNQHNCCDEEIVEQNGDSCFEIDHPPPAIVDQPRTSSHIDLVDKQRISLQEKSGLDNGNDGKPDYLSGKYSRVASKPQNDAHEIEKSTIHSKELPVLSTEKAEGGVEELVEHNQSVSLNHVNVLSTARKDTLTQIRDGNHTNLKRSSYKDKQSLQSVKKLTGKCTFDNVHETQLADISASIGKSNLPVTVNSESSTHSKMKKNKSGKSKNKFEDGSSSALPTSLSEEKTRTKSGKSISEPEALATSEDTNHSSEHFSSNVEDSREKGNGQGKSNHSRRKWAPVRALNKSEVTNEANQITEVQASSSSVKADLMQSISRNNRAEMEGYIPKPVAREMVQQGSIQHSEICSINQTTLDDNRLHSNSANNIDGRSTGFSTAKKGSISESRIGDGRHYKHRKSHRLWQQLREVELKNGQQDQSGLKSAEPQQLHKGQRVMRNNFDLDKKKLNRAEDEKKCTQSFGNEVGQRDFTAASKKNRGFGERPVSQWQPKGLSSNNQHRNWSNDSQNIRKESSIDPSAKGILNGPNASHRGAKHSLNGGPVDIVEIPPAG